MYYQASPLQQNRYYCRVTTATYVQAVVHFLAMYILAPTYFWYRWLYTIERDTPYRMYYQASFLQQNCGCSSTRATYVQAVAHFLAMYILAPIYFWYRWLYTSEWDTPYRMYYQASFLQQNCDCRITTATYFQAVAHFLAIYILAPTYFWYR